MNSYTGTTDIMRTWTAGRPSDPKTWTHFPPMEEIPRLLAWEHNTALYRGRHYQVFANVQKAYERLEIAKVADTLRNKQDLAGRMYIAANYAGLLSKTCASFLFGEGIGITPANGDESLQAQIDAILSNNEMQRLNLMQARTASAQGYTFYRVRWDTMPDWAEHGVVIDAVPGCNVTPHISPGNIKTVTGYTVAEKIKHNGKEYLRKEIHTRGTVTNELYRLHGTKIGDLVPIETIPAYANMQAVFKTEYPGLFLQYVPNLESIDEFWGASDYEDIEDLQDAINNRVSSVDYILDKHTNPKLVVPPGVMARDPSTQQLYAISEDLDVIQINDATIAQNLPRYVTWDGQLAAAFNEIDKLMEMAMLVSQMSPSVFGTSDKHMSAESAKALRIRLIQTLAKINDKRLPFEAALKNIMNAALWLHNGKGQRTSPIDQKDCDVNIKWNDGIPDDAAETTQLHADRVAAGLESQETAVAQVQGIAGEELKAEMERIYREKGQLIDNPFED